MTTDKLGKLVYGSEHISIKGDRTQKDGLATRGYDDDGVKTTEWDIIKDGKFVGSRLQEKWQALSVNQHQTDALMPIAGSTSRFKECLMFRFSRVRTSFRCRI
jgi:hypothetical protein